MSLNIIFTSNQKIANQTSKTQFSAVRGQNENLRLRSITQSCWAGTRLLLEGTRTVPIKSPQGYATCLSGTRMSSHAIPKHGRRLASTVWGSHWFNCGSPCMLAFWVTSNSRWTQGSLTRWREGDNLLTSLPSLPDWATCSLHVSFVTTTQPSFTTVYQTTWTANLLHLL